MNGRDRKRNLGDMPPEMIAEAMRTLATCIVMVADELGIGLLHFALLVFDDNSPQTSHYVGNCSREDIAEAFAEAAKKIGNPLHDTASKHHGQE